MDVGRVSVIAVAVIIGLVTVATGPIVGAIQVPEPGLEGYSQIGGGSANVTVVDAPSQARLAEGGYSDLRYLTVPDTELEISNVTGSPLLVYSLDIDDLGYSRSSTHVITSRTEGPYSLSLERDALDRSELDRQQYEGTLQIRLQASGPSRTIYEQPITVVVEQ